MAIKPGWDFPSPSNASTRGYTRERGAGSKSPAVGQNETQKNAPTAHVRKDPRAGRYAPGIEFSPVASDKNEDGQNSRTGRQAAQTNPGRKFAEGGAVRKAEGGPLTAKKRGALKSSTFALPGRRYPINDANHARNALARVSGNGTPEEKAKVRSAVHRKYPGIGKK